MGVVCLADLEAGAGAGAGVGVLVPLLLEAELDTFSVWGRELRAGCGGACRWVMLQSTGRNDYQNEISTAAEKN